MDHLGHVRLGGLAVGAVPRNVGHADVADLAVHPLTVRVALANLGTWCSEYPWNRSWRHVQAVGDTETVSSIVPVILQEPLHHPCDP